MIDKRDLDLKKILPADISDEELMEISLRMAENIAYIITDSAEKMVRIGNPITAISAIMTMFDTYCEAHPEHEEDMLKLLKFGIKIREEVAKEAGPLFPGAVRVMVKDPGKAPITLMVKNELEHFQQLVGGHIEHLTIRDGIGLIVNEEGKFEGLEKNFDLPEYNDTIVGTAVFVGEEVGNDEFVSLSEEDMKYIRANFAQ